MEEDWRFRSCREDETTLDARITRVLTATTIFFYHFQQKRFCSLHTFFFSGCRKDSTIPVGCGLDPLQTLNGSARFAGRASCFTVLPRLLTTSDCKIQLLLQIFLPCAVHCTAVLVTTSIKGLNSRLAGRYRIPRLSNLPGNMGYTIFISCTSTMDNNSEDGFAVAKPSD
jgi:hypothetical protein